MLQAEVAEKDKEVGAMRKEREENRHTIRDLSDRKNSLGEKQKEQEQALKQEIEKLKKVKLKLENISVFSPILELPKLIVFRFFSCQEIKSMADENIILSKRAATTVTATVAHATQSSATSLDPGGSNGNTGGGPGNDTQSEVMSTSTVSKAEESNRMADIESVWEEKYQKLKKLTIKMKQKTLDQQATIKKLEVRIFLSKII